MLKVLYLFLFYLIYGLTDVVLMVITIIQTLLNLFTGEPSESLQSAGRSLGVYVKQISEYLSYASEQKPYPFSDWPQVEPLVSSQEEIEPK